MKCQAGEPHARIKIAGRNINNLSYVDNTTLIAESKRKLRASWWKWKKRVKKACLKLHIQKTKIMASGPITSCQIGGETVEIVIDFVFLGSKITAFSDCSHEIKRCLLLGRKTRTYLHRILKSRDITLLTNIHLFKAPVFPVVMNGYESWTIKKAECQTTDAFEL